MATEPDHSFKTPEEIAWEGKRLFEELRTNYRIETAVDFVIADDKKDGTTIYDVTDKIEGAALSDPDLSLVDKKHLETKTEALYLSLLKYYSDKYRSGDTFLFDIPHNSRFIYGKKLGEEENNIYLNDPDIDFSNQKVRLFQALCDLANAVREMEKRLGIDYITVRKEFHIFLQAVSADDKEKFESWMRKLNEKLKEDA